MNQFTLRLLLSCSRTLNLVAKALRGGDNLPYVGLANVLSFDRNAIIHYARLGAMIAGHFEMDFTPEADVEANCHVEPIYKSGAAPDCLLETGGNADASTGTPW